MKYGFPETSNAEIVDFAIKVTFDRFVHWIAETNGRDERYEGHLPHHR